MSKVLRFEEYSITSKDVKITVTPEYLADQSNPESKIYAFSYTIQIENCGKQKVQLVNRHWQVFIEQKQTEDIKGQGVVGEQPIINPRQVFQYTSSVVLDRPVGKMCGTYTFVDHQENFFDVELPEFDLFFADEKNVH